MAHARHEGTTESCKRSHQQSAKNEESCSCRQIDITAMIYIPGSISYHHNTKMKLIQEVNSSLSAFKYFFKIIGQCKEKDGDEKPCSDLLRHREFS
jgi:hypothetical protein